MATLTATVGSTTLNLSNGAPYGFITLKGGGGADVRRVTARGPMQHGDTDKGYRLGVRGIELVIGFKATTDAILDGYRDTLTQFFKPLPNTPVKLLYTRDDAELRQIDCYPIGDIKIDPENEYRPGHYHRATIRLRAPDPSWYEVAPGTVTVTGTASIGTAWYLAGGAVGTASVLMSGSVPAQNSSWSYAGTLGTATSWTLAWRSGKVNAANNLAYYADSSGTSVYNVSFAADSGNFYLDGLSAGQEMSAGTRNYFHNVRPSSEVTDFFESGTANATLSQALQFYPREGLGLVGSSGKWRTNSTLSGTGWPEAIHLYALYSPSLSIAQMNAVSGYMIGAQGGTVAQAVVVPYEGDLPSYPTISVRGPITGASIINTATGDTLDFGTVAIGAGTTYVINTDPAYRTVTQGATNKRGELTSDSDLGEWALMPAPIATGGTNTITVTGTNTGTATQISIVYYNRFMSY